MDRRRSHFVPSAEGLENRQLMSTVKGGKSPTVAVVSSASSSQQKSSRIDKLPNYLNSLQPGRYIPPEIVTALQVGLLSVVGKLDRPASAALDAANKQYRATIGNASLSAQNAAGLNATFVSALKSANAPQGSIDALSATMRKLAQVDSQGTNPANLASSDYALILQTALMVGRPIKTPAAPTLSSSSNTGSKDDNSTTITQPFLVGRYDAGTTIQLLDDNNGVIGTAAVNNSGQYSVAPSSPLSVGKHKLRVRAYDSLNNFSEPSKPITITITAKKS